MSWYHVKVMCTKGGLLFFTWSHLSLLLDLEQLPKIAPFISEDEEHLLVQVNKLGERKRQPPPTKVRILSRTLGKNPISFEATQTHVQWEGDMQNFTAVWGFRGPLLQDGGPLTNTVLHRQQTLRIKYSVSFRQSHLRIKQYVYHWVLFMNKFLTLAK